MLSRAPSDHDERWMNSGLSAHFLGYRQGTFRNKSAAGEIPHLRRSGRIYCWRPALEVWKVGYVEESFRIHDAAVADAEAAAAAVAGAEQPRLKLA